LDGSADSRAALQFALKLFKPFTEDSNDADKDELHVVHVVYIVKTSFLDPMHDRIELITNFELRQAAVKLQTEFSSLVSNSHNQVFWHAQEGDPKHVLLEKIKEVKADLVIVGTRGLGLIAKLVVGSVSDFLVRNAPCPVTVVRNPDKTG